MKGKKIAFFVLNIYQTGGIEKVVSIIANSLCKKHDITIVSLFKTADEPRFDLDKSISILPLCEKPVNVRRNFLSIKRKIKKALSDNTFDVFINCGMGYVPMTIFMRKSAKYIAWEHSNCNIGKKFGLTWLGRYLSNKYADYIVFLTEKDRKNFKCKFKFNGNEDKLVQIYNPYECVTKTMKYDENSTKIISCGRLEHQKGFDILLDVAKILFSNTEASDWTWDIYGDGNLKEELLEKIDRQRLNGKVNLMGNANNLDEIYKDYSMFALTSRYEGFCMVNIEASTNLLPIVSFNCDCGPDEIIINGVNGYIIEDFNVEEMANKILSLIIDNQKRIEFSNNSQLDKEKLKLDVIINKWEDLLDNCGEKK